MIVKKITSEQTTPLRHEILRKGRPVEECYYPADNNKGSFHLGVFQEGSLICIGSFYQENTSKVTCEKGYRLRGMATDEKFRKQNAGFSLLKHSLEIIREKGGDLLWCNARTGVLHYYEKFGFSVHGPEFNIPAIGPHLFMYKRLDIEEEIK